MPIKDWIPGIGAAVGAIGQGVNAIFTHNQTIRNNRNAREFYQMERKDNLADWAMQNQYNSPAQQMARLKEAGLNPNLVYGSGAQQSAAGPVKGANANASPGQPVNMQLGEIFKDFVQITSTMAQTDNLKEMNENIKLRSQATNLDNVMRDLKIAEQDTKNRYQTKFLDTSLQGLEYKNKLTFAQQQYTLNEDERREALTASNLQQAVERIALMKAQTATTQAQKENILQQTKNLVTSGKLLQFEADLNRDGITKNDPVYLRIIQNILHKLFNF